MAHVRQSKSGFGRGFQVKVPKTFQVVPTSLGCGGALEKGEQVPDAVARALVVVHTGVPRS